LIFTKGMNDGISIDEAGVVEIRKIVFT